MTSNATSAAAAQFLRTLQEQLPFEIHSIQVDGGSEFRRHFEAVCERQKIPLFVLPPKQPKMNGGVERGNRTFREDFYARKDLIVSLLPELQKELKSAVHKYNTYRPHQSLNGLTPWQYTQEILENSLALSESHIL